VCTAPAGAKPGDLGEAPLVRARREDLLDSVIPALADHFTEDTSNEQLFFWVYDHGVGPLQPGPVAERLGGSASRVGTRAAPGADAGAQVRILGRFTLPDGAPSLLPLNVAGANVKLQALLDELLGARELEATVRARAPITLGLRPGGKASSAIFDFLAPPDGKPRMRATVQSANGRDYRFQLTVDRGTIPGFPLVCDGLRPARASLATAFTVNASSSATVLTVQDWRCLDLVGGQANQPRSLRLP